MTVVPLVSVGLLGSKDHAIVCHIWFPLPRSKMTGDHSVTLQFHTSISGKNVSQVCQHKISQQAGVNLLGDHVVTCHLRNLILAFKLTLH